MPSCSDFLLIRLKGLPKNCSLVKKLQIVVFQEDYSTAPVRAEFYCINGLFNIVCSNIDTRACEALSLTKDDGLSCYLGCNTVIFLVQAMASSEYS